MKTIILGPCVMESYSLLEEVGAFTHELSAKYQEFDFVFKSSFDKANRTSHNSFRGPGLEKGMLWMSDLKSKYDLRVTSDIHEAYQASPAGEVLDIIQIPAFLCRQTDLLMSAGKTNKPVNVKKGQFLAPWDMENVIAKLKESNCDDIMITDRGTQFGYNNLVADMRSIPIMKEFGYPVIFDATHSAQLPGGDGKTTGGMRSMIPTLARSAVAAGCNGIFMEVHDNVENAKSDASTQWPLDQLESVLSSLMKIRDVVN